VLELRCIEFHFIQPRCVFLDIKLLTDSIALWPTNSELAMSAYKLHVAKVTQTQLLLVLLVRAVIV